MRPQEKGLTNEDIERILKFDWDVSSDEKSGDEVEDISAVLEKNLEGLVERGESIEIEILDNILADEFHQESSGGVNMCFEKIESKSLKWRSRPFEAPETVLKDDYILEVHEVLTPVEYFEKMFDTRCIDLITQQTNLFGLQELGIELNCTKVEIRRYIGVLLYLGVIRLPQFKMAWAQNIKLTAITEAMSRGVQQQHQRTTDITNSTWPTTQGTTTLAATTASAAAADK